MPRSNTPSAPAILAALGLAALPCMAQYLENFESWPVGTPNPAPWTSLGTSPPATVQGGVNHTGLPVPWPSPLFGPTGQNALVIAGPNPYVGTFVLGQPTVGTTGTFREDMSLLCSPVFEGIVEIQIETRTPQGVEPVVVHTIHADGTPAPDFTTSAHLVDGQIVKSVSFFTNSGQWLSIMSEVGPTARECIHTGSQTIWYTSLGRPSDHVATTIRVTSTSNTPGAFVAIDDVALTNHSNVCMPDLTASAIPGTPGYGMPNGVLNNDDFFYFLTQFAAGNLDLCDFTSTAIPGAPGYGVANGVLSNDDFFFFLQLFAQGCQP